MGITRRLFESLRLAERQPAPDLIEHGSNSVSYASDKTGVAKLLDTEYRYELRGVQGGRTYQRMRWSDPHISGLREAQNLPIIQAGATIEPAITKESEPGYTEAQEKAELVERLLVREAPWRSFVQDSLIDADYGFACFEIVWSKVGDELRPRLAYRPSSSISTEDIYVRAGRIDHVVQMTVSEGQKTIPGEHILWFAHQKEGDSFQGRPVLRAMYKPWKIKEELEIELPIMVRKLGGIPEIVTDGEPSAEIRAELDEMGQRFGLAPDAFARHSSDVTINLLTGNANVRDVLEAIKQRNQELTSVCNAQVLDLGTSNVGSRALGTTLADMFNSGVQARAKQREDVLNASDGLIHQIVAYNFPRDDLRPTLRFGHVQAIDLRAFAQSLVALSQAFAALDSETEEWARSEANMPAGTTTQTVVPEKGTVPAAAVPAPEPEPTAAAGGVSEAGAKASESLRLAERRAPRGVECYVALAEVAARFDDAKTAIRTATQATRDSLVKELASRAQAAQEKGQLTRFVAGAPPMVDRLTSEIRVVLEDFYAAGQQQVADELQRQREGEPVTEERLEARQAGIKAAEKPRRRRRSLPPDLDEQAEITARSIAQSTQASAATNAARIASGVPLPAAALIEAITRDSDTAALRMAATVTDLMQAGRGAQAAVERDIETAVYSAILDSSACDVCLAREGNTTRDVAAAEEWTPNPECVGGDNCRCVTIYELRLEGET